MEKIIQDFLADPENKVFLGKLLGDESAAKILEANATAEEVENFIKEAEKKLKKGSKGYKRRGEQYLDLYSKEVDFNDPTSKKDFIEYLNNYFARSLELLHTYLSSLQKEKGEEGESPEEGGGKPAEVHDVGEEAAAKSLISDIERGLKTQYSVLKTLKKNIAEAFGELYSLKVPGSGSKSENPSSERIQVLRDASDRFSKKITEHIGLDDFNLILDFYGELQKRPEDAMNRFPLLKKIDQAKGVALLEKLLDYVVSNGKLPSGSSYFKIPGKNYGKDEEGNDIPGSNKEEIMQDIRETIKKVSEGSLDFTKSYWLRNALKISKPSDIVGNIYSSLKAHPIDVRGRNSDVADVLLSMTKQPFGPDGLGILNTDLESLEDKVLDAIDGILSTLSISVREVKSTPIKKHPARSGDYMDLGTPSFVRKPVGDVKVKSPFSDLPQETDILQKPSGRPSKSVIESNVSQALTKAFPTLDIARVRSLKDVGDEWTKNKGPSPMEGIRDSLSQAFSTLSNIDTDAIRAMAEDFGSDEPDSPVNVALDNVEEIDEQLSNISDLADTLDTMFDVKQDFVNPFDSMVDSEEDPAEKRKLKGKRRSYNNIYRGVLSSLEESIKGAIDLNPNSSSFLTVNLDKALEPVQGLDIDGRALKPGDIPENIKDLDPNNRALTSGVTKNELNLLYKKAKNFVLELSGSLKQLRRAYEETNKLLKTFTDKAPPVPVEGEILKKMYETALQDRNYRTVLTGDSSTFNYKELSEGKVKKAASSPAKKELRSAIRNLNRGLQTLKDLSESSIKDMKDSPVFKRLEDFHGAMAQLDNDHNFGSNLVTYIISRTSPGDLHKFIEDYHEFYVFSKVLKKAKESLEKLSTSIVASLEGSFSIYPSKKTASSEIRIAANLIKEGNIVKAAAVLKKVAAQSFGPLGESKPKVDSISPENLESALETVKKNSNLLHDALNFLDSAVEDAYASKESDVDMDQVVKAIKSLAGVESFNKPVRFKSNADRVIQNLKDMINLGKRGDYQGGSSEDQDIRYLMREQNVNYIHSALASLSQEINHLFSVLKNINQKLEDDVKNLTEYHELTDKSLKALEGVSSGISSKRIPKDSLNSILSDSTESFLLSEAKKNKNREVSGALKGIRESLEKYETVTDESGTNLLLDESKVISDAYKKALDPLTPYDKPSSSETEEQEKERLEKRKQVSEGIKDETEEDREAREEKAKELREKLEIEASRRLRQLKGHVETIEEFVKDLERQSKEVQDTKISLEGYKPSLKNMMSSLPNAKESLDSFLKHTHQRKEEKENKSTRSYLDISDNPFTTSYSKAMGSAIRSSMHKAVLSLHEEGKEDSVEYIESLMEQEPSVKDLVETYNELANKNQLNGAEQKKLDGLVKLLSYWPDKSVSWGIKKLQSIREMDKNSEGSVRDWKSRDVLKEGITSYLKGESDSLKDAINGEAISQLGENSDDVSFNKVMESMKDIPDFNLKSEVKNLEEELKDSSSDRNKFKQLMRSDAQRKEFLDKSSQARDKIESLHPSTKSTRAHAVAQKTLGSFTPGKGKSFKEAIEEALKQEATRPGENKLKLNQVKHAILDMASLGNDSDYEGVKSLLKDGRWDDPSFGTDDKGNDALSKAKRYSLQYSKNQKPSYGSNAHSRANRVLKGEEILTDAKPKSPDRLSPVAAEDYFQDLQSYNNSVVKSSLPEGKSILNEYAKELTDKIHKLRKERSSMGDSAEEKSYSENLTKSINSIIDKLNTYHGNRKAGIEGSYKDLAKEAYNHYLSKAQNTKDRALAFSKYRAEKAKGDNDRTEQGEVSRNRANELAKKYNFDENTDFEQIASEAAKAHRKATSIAKSVLGRKGRVELEGSDIQDTASHDKYFSGGQGYGAGDLDQGSISTNLGGGNQRYILEEAQQFLINWVNHLKESSATDFTDDGYIYEAMDKSLDKLIKKIRSSYKGSRIEGFEIDGVKYPGILDELKQKRNKWEELLKNIKESDKSLSESFHPLMEDLAKVVKENEEMSSKMDSAVNDYYKSYEEMSNQQSKQDFLKSKGLVENEEGLVGPEGVEDIKAYQEAVTSAMEVNSMHPDQYSNLVDSLGGKLRDIVKNKGMKDISLTNAEKFILGPSLVSKLEKADTDLDATNAAKSILTKETDRFRDYEKEAEKLLDKLSYFEGSAKDIQDRLDKSPITFTEKEYELMGPKLETFIKGVLDGDITGRSIRINGPEAKKAIGGDFRQHLESKAKKIKKHNLDLSTRTVLGEKSLRDARNLHKYISSLKAINEDHEASLQEIEEDNKNGDFATEDLYYKAIEKENNRHARRLSNFHKKKMDLSREFQKDLRKATGGKPISMDNIEEVQSALEKAFTHGSGPVSSAEMQKIKEIESTLSELEELEKNPPVNNDPSSIKKYNERKEFLRNRTTKGVSHLRKSDHPSLVNLTDIAVQRFQSNQSSRDSEAISRVAEWLDTAEGKKLLQEYDANGLVGNTQLLEDLKRISPLKTKAVSIIREPLVASIRTNMEELSGLISKIKSKSYTQSDLDAFAEVMQVAEGLLYKYLSGYFSPADIRVYRSAKDLMKTPFIKARVLGEMAESDGLGASLGSFNIVEGLVKLEGNDSLNSEDKNFVSNSIPKVVGGLTRRLEGLMSSDKSPEEVLKDKDLREVHKIIHRYPDLISEDFEDKLKEWETSLKEVRLSDTAEELLKEKDELISNDVPITSSRFSQISRSLSRVVSQIDDAMKGSKNKDKLENLKKKILDSKAEDSLVKTNEAQKRVNEAFRKYVDLVKAKKENPEETFRGAKKDILIKTEKALEALNNLEDLTPIRLPDDVKSKIPQDLDKESILKSLHALHRSTMDLMGKSGETSNSKKAAGSDDYADFDKQNWALQNATKSYPGAPGSSSPAEGVDRVDHKFKDIRERDKVIRALKDSYDKIVKSQGKGRTLPETKVDSFPVDSLQNSSRGALEAIRHFQKANGIRKRSPKMTIDDLASQVHAINRHESKHGPSKLSDSQKKIINTIKSRWSKMEGTLEKSIKDIESKIKNAEKSNAEDHVIDALKGRKEQLSKDLTKHAELSKKGAGYEGDKVHNLLSDLHQISLEVEQRMEEFVELSGREGTGYAKDQVKASEALSQLHEALKRLGEGQAKLRNAQDLAHNEIERLDDLIDGWSKSLSHAKANGGNGLSEQEERMWSRMFLNQIMHWLMWVWNRNADRFEKVFNAREEDFDKFSKAVQSRVGMFNNPRVNKLMMQLTETIDQVGGERYKNMPEAAKKKLKSLKNARSRLFMYKYSLSHLKDLMDNIRVWADKHDLEVDRKQERETQKALEKAMKDATNLAAETAYDLDDFEKTLGVARELEEQRQNESIKKMAHLSLGYLNIENLNKVLENYRKRR